MDSNELKLGAHLGGGDSILKVGADAVALGLNVVQLFLSSPLKLTIGFLDKGMVAEYREKYGHLLTVVHGPFILNLASEKANEKFCIKYIGSLVTIMQEIGAEYMVLHVGANEDEREGRRIMKRRLRAVLEQTKWSKVVICLETDVGGGSRMGSWKNLRNVVKSIKSPRLRLCIDTAHMYAAGHDFAKQKVMDLIVHDKDFISVVHINEPEPKVKLGGHLDRHNNDFGTGPIGKEKLLEIAGKFRDKVLIVECRDRDAVAFNVGVIRHAIEG